MTNVTDRLDAALSGRRGSADEDIMPLVAAWHALEPLRSVPSRSPEAEQVGLRAFLSEAAQIRAKAVSAPPTARRNGWIFQLPTSNVRTPKSGKEHSPVFALAVKLVLVLALSVGGVGTTALAAQGSLPNDLLYPVKLATEDVGLALTADPQARLNLLLEQAQVRTIEMARLAERNEAIPGDVPLRLQTQLEAALHVAAQLGEPQMIAALGQICRATQTQSQLMKQVRLRDPQNQALQAAERALTRTRGMCELGLSEPQRLRHRINDGRPDTTPDQPDATPGEGNGYGPGPQATPCNECTPQGDQNQYRNQYGPQPTGTPEPGSGCGPGPQATPCGGCTPEGDQNRNQHQNQYGPRPSGTPDPGDGYGPGPQATPCGECTPQGDQNQYGPGPQPTGTLEPGAGNSSGPDSQLTESPGNENDNGNDSGGGGNGRP